jgi:hypothetical protein
MNQMNRLPLIRLGFALMAAFLLTACRDAQDARKAQAAAKSDLRDRLAKRGPGGAAAGGAAKSRSARPDSGPPFERVVGYVVRGTDESSFRRCGSTRTQYIRAVGEAASQVNTRYRFKASTPLAPVYFVFRARVVDDTVVVGDHTYTSVLEVRSVYPENPGEKAECPAPMRGSMIADR